MFGAHQQINKKRRTEEDLENQRGGERKSPSEKHCEIVTFSLSVPYVPTVLAPLQRMCKNGKPIPYREIYRKSVV